MILTLSLLAGIAIAWALVAAMDKYIFGLDGAQALLYAPFKLAYRISDRSMRIARSARPPVIYAIVHQSRLEPALMLSLLPADTLHILDPASARAAWLEPWRALSRTIAFNAEHVFVSRRLVRMLKGRGRLAVYFPDDPAPDAKGLRLYRAVARIAMQADAGIVPIFVDGARRHLFPRLKINVLEPMTIAEMSAAAADPAAHSRNVLFDRVTEARVAA